MRACENCGEPATLLRTFSDGSEVPTCDGCRPGNWSGTMRALDSDAPDPPLTLAQAAARAKKSDRTLRRWLPQLEADGVAKQVGGRWAIDGEGLDRFTFRGGLPRPRIEARRRPASRRKKVDMDEFGWPVKR